MRRDRHQNDDAFYGCMQRFKINKALNINMKDAYGDDDKVRFRKWTKWHTTELNSNTLAIELKFDPSIYVLVVCIGNNG